MVPITAPRAMARIMVAIRTARARPIGTLPHNFLFRQGVFSSASSDFSKNWFSFANNDADEESEGSAGMVWLLDGAVEVVGATLPV